MSLNKSGWFPVPIEKIKESFAFSSKDVFKKI